LKHQTPVSDQETANSKRKQLHSTTSTNTVRAILAEFGILHDIKSAQIQRHNWSTILLFI
jgi:hypothetical protein